MTPLTTLIPRDPVPVEDRIAADVRYVETLISEHIELQATSPIIHVGSNDRVYVEVAGASSEAHAWRAAISGRLFPSHIDIHGVRRQDVLGKRVTIWVAEQVRHERYTVKPHYATGGYFWAIFDTSTPGDTGVEVTEDHAALMTLAAEMNFQADRTAGIR